MKRSDKSEDWTQRRIQSIEVGFQVIRAMEAAEGALPLRDIAAAAGMPASKVHLYLVSFVREGMAYQDPATGHYGLGPFAIQLGLSAIRQLDVVELAQAELISLQQTLGFASYLSLWGDRGPGIVSKVDGQRQGSLAVRLGYVLPLLSSATGQVFMAYLDDSETRAVREEQMASGSNSDQAGADLDLIARTVRKQGYSMTINNINSSFAAVSAPVLGFNGRIAAALTVLGSERLLTGATKKPTIEAVCSAARHLSARLGFVDRGEAAKTSSV